MRMAPALSLFTLLFLLQFSISQSLRGAYNIDCGSAVASTVNGLDWLPDGDFISTGDSKFVRQGLPPILTTLRTFPLQGNVLKKFCYEIPVDMNRKYLVRTTYYYGGVNGNASPPIFDQIVDGTFWNVVDTKKDYAGGNASYFEGVFMPSGKNLSVCLAANTYTDSDPFISALEVVPLWDQLYNSTDFKTKALSLIARTSFGYDGPTIGYPDDKFNRYWEPFGRDAFPQSTSQNPGVSGIWNLPPEKVFQTRLARNLRDTLSLQWPTGDVIKDFYYIALYFADDQTSPSRGPRTLDININGEAYYRNLSLTPAGVVVFANEWPLAAGLTNVTLSPALGSTAGPLINAGEVLRVLPVGGKTLARDVVAMIQLRNSFQYPPADWKGDPCLPKGYSWTGVICSEDRRIRIVALNLTAMNLYGSISPSISRMTALNSILLGNNSLSGTIPDLSSLRRLEILHVENNQLGGAIPPSLGNLNSLRELFLQNNNLTGQVPSSLSRKPGLILRYTPGNPLLSP